MNDYILVIALTIMMESANQGHEGRMGVASTIWINSPSKDIVSLRSTCLTRKKYSAWNRYHRQVHLAFRDVAHENRKSKISQKAWLDSLGIAVSMTNGTFKPTVNATHYHHEDMRPWWTKGRHGKRMILVQKIREHLFYLERRS